MFAIVGATGKVGYSTSLILRKAGFPVRAILRDPAKAKPLADIGCEIALADLQDSEALAEAIADADATQVILPPSSQTKDTVREMQRVINSLAAALERTCSKRVLAISDYGAHVASDIGMPSMFRMFEARLNLVEGQKLILRSAEHMEGWARFAPTAIASGILPSFHDPIDKALPMISAHDLGRIAASLLLKPGMGNDLQIVHAEGPRRYRPVDVAEAISQLSGIPIEAQAVPRSQRKVDLLRKSGEAFFIYAVIRSN
ncbi:NmrA family transcriptional regulator [Brucella anthropi]|uniref:NmrA family NAD(P)-binding protein n=1 Tax=Brucella anthropi TaxID=529 RepID=UPI000F668EF1|nr:NAD(P)H-binding protein [Brucella anthropi]RRY15682.1 NmrA family transcriptional regulator [Brucella anthropi]